MRRLPSSSAKDSLSSSGATIRAQRNYGRKLIAWPREALAYAPRSL
jgi:hypothetical protein